MLTDIQIRAAKPRAKPYRVFDGGGLYLEVSPAGGRYWRFKYRFGGKEKRLSLGVYPTVSLKDAREKRDTARRQLAAGIDPSAARKAEKAADEDTLEAVSREWYAKHSSLWGPANAEKTTLLLERDVFPWLGQRPAREVTASEFLSVLRRVEARGDVTVAHRLRGTLGQVFRYAIATGRAERNPATDLKGALTPMKSKHFAAITDPIEVGVLMRAIDAYQGSFVVQCALKLAAYTFVRPGELRGAEWDEVDIWDGAADDWRIPAERMKMREPHIVPLSDQAIYVFHELYKLTCTERQQRYVFTGGYGRGTHPISENTINCALRAMGYRKDQMTGHGFRAMARTLLDEVLGVRPDIIEHQLAHKVKDPMGQAYNRTTHLADRRVMMQRWADFLDSLKNGADVVPLRGRA